MTANHSALQGILIKITAGFGTTGQHGTTTWLIRQRSCTTRHLPFGFCNPIMGGFYRLHLIYYRMPCSNMDSVTGFIPAMASGVRWYCGVQGKSTLGFTLIHIGSTPFFRTISFPLNSQTSSFTLSLK